MNRTLLVFAAGGLLVFGCNRQPRVIIESAPPQPPPVPVAHTETFETHALQREIDTYEHHPSAVQAARVQKAFAEIDGEIAELVEHVAKKSGDERAEAARKLTDLRTYRDAEHTRFGRLETQAPLTTERSMATSKEVSIGEKAGEKIDKAAKKVGDGLQDAADAIRDRTR